jgi:hypothetical protein
MLSLHLNRVWEMAMTTPHQRNLLRFKKPVEVLIFTYRELVSSLSRGLPGRVYTEPIYWHGLNIWKGYQSGEAPLLKKPQDRVRTPSLASLLEHKQEEKICFHNIPEGGA